MIDVGATSVGLGRDGWRSVGPTEAHRRKNGGQAIAAPVKGVETVRTGAWGTDASPATAG